MEIQIKIIGILLVILALMHVIFPSYFNWKKDLNSLSLINRQMMKTHTFFIALTVALMGLLCIFSSFELIETPLGKKLSLGMAVFWSIRLFFQLFIYSPKLWKGKVFETFIHIIFTCFWLYLAIIFGTNFLFK